LSASSFSRGVGVDLEVPVDLIDRRVLGDAEGSALVDFGLRAGAQGAQLDPLAGGFLRVGHRVAGQPAPEAVGERVGRRAGAAHRRREVGLEDHRVAVGTGMLARNCGRPSSDCQSDRTARDIARDNIQIVHCVYSIQIPGRSGRWCTIWGLI